MRTFFRALGAVVLLALIAGGVLVYTTVWGTPFRFNWLLDRQAMSAVIDKPELLTQIGAVDGTVLDFHSGKLDAYSLDERAKGYDQLRRFEGDIKAWDRAKLSSQEQLS